MKSNKKVNNKNNKNNNNNNKIITISGLDIDTSYMIIHIVSAIIGIIVFYFVPLLANHLNRPITAILLNVIPNSLILGFFVVEEEFSQYLEGVSWTPFLNVFANICSYIALVYFKWSAIMALILNVFIWLFSIFLSIIYNGKGKNSKNKIKKDRKNKKIFL